MWFGSEPASSGPIFRFGISNPVLGLKPPAALLPSAVPFPRFVLLQWRLLLGLLFAIANHEVRFADSLILICSVS